jgi:hypothetical protein
MVIRDPDPDVDYDPMAAVTGPVRKSVAEAKVEVVQGMLKRGTSGRWEVLCDEPPDLGGLDLAPAPLEYFALALLF